ncbi:MAG: leucine-rich repeat protein [Lachnospiraceae bacterium]|nr:leucine-rich repeat protein [Lachnospiraceae bacterium]
MNKTVSTPQGKISYETGNEEAVLLSYEGSDQYLVLPEFLDGCPVTSIAPKAFLGQRTITQLILPVHLKVLGDWAFAHMTGLKALSLPPNHIRLEKQVFLDCPVLSEIRITHSNQDNSNITEDPALPFYLAAVISVLKNPSLFHPDLVGNTEWYESFDKAVCHLLSRPDDEGFEPVYLGWFEDEDVMATQYPAYIRKRQLEKAALSMKRLHFPFHLSAETKEIYETYVTSHFQTGVWEQCCTPEYVSDSCYIKILIDLGCITEENISRLLSDLNNLNSGETAETIAMLLHYRETSLQKEDFFNNLSL